MESCANCLGPLSLNFEETQRNSICFDDADNFHLKLVNSSLFKNEEKNKNIKMMDKIAAIYKLDYLSLLTHLNEEDEKNICEKCSTVFQTLYTSYDQFNKLRHMDSYISQQIDKLDKIIQTFQYQDSSSEIQESTCPIQKNVKNEQQQEEEIDNEMDNIDMEYGMDDNFSQDDDGNDSTIPDPTNNSTSSQVEVPSSIMLKDPWIKLKRLSNEEIMSATSSRTKIKKKRRKKEKDEPVQKRTMHTSLWEDHLEVTESGYLCKTCNISYTSKTGCKRHVLSVHGDQPYKCTIPNCTRSFVTLTGLNVHVMIHNGEKFKCPICEKLLSSPTNLTAHIRVLHEGQKPFLCSICGSKFAQASSLRIHALIHGEERAYKCSFCDKSFKQYKILAKHVKIHSERTVLCPVCGKTMMTLNGLRNHLRNVHAPARS